MGETAYCAVCHKETTGPTKIFRGKRMCMDCYNHRNDDKEARKQMARQNDQEKEGFFSFLLSLFPNRGTVPDSWYVRVDGMLRKGFDCTGIARTLNYCISSGMSLTEDNWSTLVYTYYTEAEAAELESKEAQEVNDKVVLNKGVRVVKVKSTTYRDMPPFNIDDL